MLSLVESMYRGVTPLSPLLWQAEADTELTLSVSPTTEVGQKALAQARRCYSTVLQKEIVEQTTIPEI